MSMSTVLGLYTIFFYVLFIQVTELQLATLLMKETCIMQKGDAKDGCFNSVHEKSKTN